MRLIQTNDNLPKVVVLLAAYNGIRYIEDQLNSILNQAQVDITVYVSIDKSSDGTEVLLSNWALKESRLKLLPFGVRFGSAGSNFYRLIKEVDFLSYDYVAYADQDDIWSLYKTTNQIKLMEIYRAHAVSSDIIAFGREQKNRLIVKSHPQKEFDYIFESAGPGCSFLMKPSLVDKIYHQLMQEDSLAAKVIMHDWLTYSICRAYGMRWHIDSTPTLKYRQHSSNVIGANLGLRSMLSRYLRVQKGWYRAEVSKICRVCFDINGDKNLFKLINILDRKSFLYNLLLLPYVFKGRRKIVDRLFLVIMVFLCVF